MENRETLQHLVSRGRQQLTECRTRVNRLDSLKGILFMRRDVACLALEAHIDRLQSRLSILRDQGIPQIEQLCEEKEKCMNAEKDIELNRIAYLTELCNRSTDYLQFGNEDLYKTAECEKIIDQLRESAERCNLNDDASDARRINLFYQPLLSASSLNITSFGMVKTSHLDPRATEIERLTRGMPLKVELGVGSGLSIYVATNCPKLSTDDLASEDLEVKLKDSSNAMVEVTLALCPNQKHKFRVTFSPKIPERYILTVKLYGIDVVNSPYKFSTRAVNRDSEDSGPSSLRERSSDQNSSDQNSSDQPSASGDFEMAPN